MQLPEARTRPSLMLPLSNAIGLLGGVGSLIIGPDKAIELIKVASKTIEKEQDEYLRILNEHDVDSKDT